MARTQVERTVHYGLLFVGNGWMTKQDRFR